MNINESIRAYMRLHGITQTELAKRIGINQQTIASNLARDMRVSALEKILDGLQADPAEIFNGATGTGTTTTGICPHCGKPVTICLK